jgi:hypothetical protein
MSETHHPGQNDQADDQADEDLVEVTEPPSNQQVGGDALAHAQPEEAAGEAPDEPEPRATAAEGGMDVDGDRSMELDEDDDLFEEVTA